MPDPITCFLVDDEPLARMKMAHMLAGFPDIHIAGEYGNGLACIEATLENAPDLIFLDIGLPDHNGLEVVSELAAEMTRLPFIVFATAFNEHAITAFELNALDYLLKPVSLERLKLTIERVREVFADEDRSDEDRKLRGWMEKEASQQNGSEFATRIEVKERGNLSFVPVVDIRLIQADGNYLEIHAGDKPVLVRMTMARLEKQLDPQRFVRVSRSAIVAVKNVIGIEKAGRHDSWVQLNTGERVGASRNLEELERLVRDS